MEHEIQETEGEVTHASGGGSRYTACSRQLRDLLATLNPFVPSIFGDALRDLKVLALAGANDEHGIAPHRPIPLGALKLNSAFENLHLEKSLVKVNPEARYAPGSQRGGSGLYFVEIVTLWDHIESSVPLMEGHAIHLAAARPERKLSELDERELPQPRRGGVLKFHFRISTVRGGDSEAFLNRRVHQTFSPFRNVRSLEGYRPLHKAQAHNSRVR